MRSSYDIIVVGARVAGAATAMLLARSGCRVCMIDRGRHGSDTVSTHALMRGGVVQLKRWGLLPTLVATDTPAIRRTTFHYGDQSLPLDIKLRSGVDALYAPRRTTLDALLSDAARDSGVDVRYGMRLRDLTRRSDGRVNGIITETPDGERVTVRADLVVGADGIKSTVAALVDAPTLEAGRHAAAAAYGYWSDLDFDGYHWHYVPGLGVGAIPTTGAATCLFITTTPARFQSDLRLDLSNGFRRLLAGASAELAGRVEGREPVEALHAFPGVKGYVRQARGPGWALVGDAGFFRDPVTAHGMTDALRDAELLAAAYIADGETGLAAYERERNLWALDMLRISDEIASFEWDLDSLRPMHKALNRIMAREAEMLAARTVPA